MSERATITLYIDPDAYREETGEELTLERLREIGVTVNEDSSCIYGYESWAIALPGENPHV